MYWPVGLSVDASAFKKNHVFEHTLNRFFSADRSRRNSSDAKHMGFLSLFSFCIKTQTRDKISNFN